MSKRVFEFKGSRPKAASTAQTAMPEGLRRFSLRFEPLRRDPATAIISRLGILGTLAASAGAASLLAADASQNGAVPFALLGVATAGAIAAARGLDTQKVWLTSTCAWFAGLGALSADAPILALAGAAAWFATGFIKAHDASAEPARIADTPEQSATDGSIAIAANNTVVSTGKNCPLPLSSGERFIDRVHVADRVEFLRALSDVRHDGMDRTVPVRIDMRGAQGVQQFRSCDVLLVKDLEHGLLRLDIKADAPAQTTPGENAAKADTNKRFLAIVSHELRTPLNAIIGFSDVLRGGLAGPLESPRQREYVDLIHGAGTHLLSLVNTILDVSKIESGNYAIHPETFDFAITARECLSMVEGQAEARKIHLNEWIVGDMGSVIADRRAVKQILLNLLSNAVKYTGEGGCVTLDARMREGGIEFKVTDTGIGISSEDLKRLGQPFVQVDNDYTRNCEGTGLGLAMVKGLVELHGGTVAIASQPELGTEVSIFIPERIPENSDEGSSESSNVVPHIAGIKRKDFRKETAHATRKAV